ncbi:MAG: DUF1488 domain-containing protein [Acetobacteraceae bacterium]|nr:DUF1488 domain-containing protein [Acetobacteraceae bacterium]
MSRGALPRRPGPAPLPDEPRSDGRRVLFTVVADGRPIPCAIAQHALRDLAAGGKRPGGGDLLTCFLGARPRIEAMALRKIRGRRGDPLGVLYIWPEDAVEGEADAALS